ncbi:MAG: methylated-DNA--[protein]-cysteine S-methyltransferase [candidate division Zixibacteria bacterium]|nr:methylated-DNA--[protein]-cysteine S-methyltransferase [candidate division Zixibacteria bacterium]
MKLYYTTIKSPVGEILATRTDRGLNFIAFPKNRWQKFLSALRKDENIILIEDKKRFSKLRNNLRAYFSGREVQFKEKFDLKGGTNFQEKVWRAMQRIPFGQTRSYGWLAKQVGGKNKARAVGMACGSNPIPILIPCHRVIREDGELGGYGGGLGMKKKLLKIEGVNN